MGRKPSIPFCNLHIQYWRQNCCWVDMEHDDKPLTNRKYDHGSKILDENSWWSPQFLDILIRIYVQTHMRDFTTQEELQAQSNCTNLHVLAVTLKRSCLLGLRNCKIRPRPTISSFWCLRSQNQQGSLGDQRKGSIMLSGYTMMMLRGCLLSNSPALDSTAD